MRIETSPSNRALDAAAGEAAQGGAINDPAAVNGSSLANDVSAFVQKVTDTLRDLFETNTPQAQNFLYPVSGVFREPSVPGATPFGPGHAESRFNSLGTVKTDAEAQVCYPKPEPDPAQNVCRIGEPDGIWPNQTPQPADKPQPLQVKTPWYSQFEGGHGFDPSNIACYDASKAMAKAAGAKLDGTRIQIGTAEDSQGKLTVDSKKAAEGRSYIDSELAANRPVVVGVSHMDAAYNADKLTDHFVVITGRGVDKDGRVYYTFHDPGAGPGSPKGADTRVENRFYVDPKTGGLSRAGKAATGYVVDRHYDVSMVMRNAEPKK